jgi:hypothetical protein
VNPIIHAPQLNLKPRLASLSSGKILLLITSTMSQYKSAVRPQQSISKSSPYREKATQLHELFPHLPVDGTH